MKLISKSFGKSILILALSFCISNALYADESTTQIEDGDIHSWQVISGGGTVASSIDYKLMGTISQTSVGTLSGTGYDMESGFWQDVIGAQPCNCTPGDPNNNGIFELVDIVYLINYVYLNGEGPIPQTICGGDVRMDCSINILDITFMIAYLYEAGQEPGSCLEWTAICGN